MPKQLFLKIREIFVNKIIPYSKRYFTVLYPSGIYGPICGFARIHFSWPDRTQLSNVRGYLGTSTLSKDRNVNFVPSRNGIATCQENKKSLGQQMANWNPSSTWPFAKSNRLFKPKGGFKWNTIWWIGMSYSSIIMIFIFCFREDLIRDYWTNATGILRSKISNRYQWIFSCSTWSEIQLILCPF